MAHVPYDLLSEPWIPCVDLQGKPYPLGIREALERAPELADITHSSPLVRAALIRLLLAVLHAALQGPRSNETRAEWWEAGAWDGDRLRTYLSDQADRFDLFHPEYPFFQDVQQTVENPKSITCLAPELASGNNATLFDHTRDDRPPAVSAAEAARWLVATQCFALGGLDRSRSEAYGLSASFYQSPAVRGAVLLLQGETLFQTLLLNLVPYTARAPFPQVGPKLDEPIWERTTPPPPGQRPVRGYLDYLTWPSRCVRLELAEGAATPGDLRITRVHLSQGSVFREGSDAPDPFFAMTARNAKQEPRPVRMSADQVLWRDSTALFGSAADDTAPRKGGIRGRPHVLEEAAELAELLDYPGSWGLTAAGLDFDQAKINLWRAEELPVPQGLLSQPAAVENLQAAVKRGDEAGGWLRTALRIMAGSYVQPPNPSRPDARADPNAVDALLRSWRADAQYWPALEAPYRCLLAGMGGSPEQAEAALSAWKNAVYGAAVGAFEYAGAQVGRDNRAYRARIGAEEFLFARLRALRGGREQ